MIRDLASRNGTLVNGKLVEGERPLLTGDLVQIGTLVFEVQYDEVTMAPETVNRHAEPTAQIEARPTDHHENETDVPLEMHAGGSRKSKSTGGVLDETVCLSVPHTQQIAFRQRRPGDGLRLGQGLRIQLRSPRAQRAAAADTGRRPPAAVAGRGEQAVSASWRQFDCGTWGCSSVREQGGSS